MTGRWDHSVDLVIAGSGGGGMVAGLAALDCGLEPLIIEKQPLVGGSTGLSGGIVWLPNNPLMRADGIADSHEEGLAYLADVVGDIGAPSSPERREMFLTAGFEMINFLTRKGVALIRCAGWSDYYPNHKGGNASGRAVEGIPFDAARLGDWSDKVQPPLAKNYGYVVLTNELRSVQYFNRAPRAFAVAARVFLRTAIARARRRQLLTNGASLIAQMLKALIDLSDGDPPLWTQAAMTDLVVDDGRVVGVRVVRDGRPLTVEARKGVLLAAGGFGHNEEMRRRYSGNQPNEGKWSIANAGDTGEVLEAAMRLGAKTDLLDEAWWLPSVFIANGGAVAASLGSGRQRPGAIYVDSTGRRFCNESNSYVEVGKAMYANKAVPCWMIFDEGYVRRYVTSASPLKTLKRNQPLPAELIESGAVTRAASIPDLARQIDLPADELARTIRRFNQFSAKGLDPDFGRGQSAYNDCLGDPGYRPNAAIGPLDTAPYYATRVLPADVGTCGGVITNEHAQVLDQQDRVIEGLYATGNTTATVMGRTYPGAGASIASSMVFGYVAARHAAGRKIAGEMSR
ncbi:3-ketosteroid-delta-1-dehydrogenase [Mycobacterium sp. 1165196.3]|uniref:FAD-binding protein n=1 Tax=unclassified Mycobacterium TaxID=2642494 RepID=UPI0007FE4CF3|nr:MULTISPECIES: FAD-binding protein [unclassified Mycobacterium]OBJ11704.1 3-ketosteroid-delta-1-dehydrogenase [Mycobacterium sp. 1482292.6]OBK28758.1 3-ketosteroid-delta-1-dehydrogenase [Mycobacterium sp. 1165196.3]